MSNSLEPTKTAEQPDIEEVIDGIVEEAREPKLKLSLVKSPTPLAPYQGDNQVWFSRYHDGTLRLFKEESLIGDTPAGYSEENVSVKIMIRTHGQEFMVCIRTTRHDLDKPGAEVFLAQMARNWSK